MKTADALSYAQGRELDLVEVAADAKPPVCRVLDYSKYKYEKNQREKQARKHQQQITVREIKFRPKIAEHDYATKKGHVTRFLNHRDKVKVTIMFRGREVAHPERGEIILNRLAEELGELAIIEQRPQQDGRNMTMMLGPGKTAGVDAEADEALDGATPEVEVVAPESAPVPEKREPEPVGAPAAAAEPRQPAAPRTVSKAADARDAGASTDADDPDVI